MKEIKTSNAWTILCDENGYWVKPEELGKHIRYNNPRKETLALFRHNKDRLFSGLDYTYENARNPIFSKSGALKLAKLSLIADLTIIEEVIKAFGEADRSNMTIDPNLPIGRLFLEFKTAHTMSLKFGLSGNAAILSANNAVKKLHGHDCLKIFEIPLGSYVNDKLLTPGDIGWFIKSDAETVNRALEHMGLQKSNRDKHGNLYWTLTEAGKQYGVYIDTGKVHNSGAMVQQIKWYENVVRNVDEDIRKFGTEYQEIFGKKPDKKK